MRQIQDNHAKLQSHEKRADFLERQDRLSVLIVDGLTLDNSISIGTNIIVMVKQYLDLEILPEDIIVAHKLPRIDNSKSVDSVRVKFREIEIKRILLRSKGRLRGSEIYFREHLTLFQSKIFYHARLAK